MKLLFIILLLSLLYPLAHSQIFYDSNSIKKDPEMCTEWIDMDNACIKKVLHQIQVEINAALLYLSIGSYFAEDTVNRLGFSNFFLDAAKEERYHAIYLINYLAMRGTLNISKPLIQPNFMNVTILTGQEALKKALDAEISVTNSIRNVIKECEQNSNDYHLVDYLTGVYLDEQYKGQRDLAGKISTLGKMINAHGELGEFLFDKLLLEIEKDN